MKNKNQIAIIGGAGHIGAPLGINLSHAGYQSILIDLNKDNINLINNGKMPFVEKGAEKILKKQLKRKKIFASFKFVMPPPTDIGTKQFEEKYSTIFKNSLENFFFEISIKISSSIFQRLINFFVYL